VHELLSKINTEKDIAKYWKVMPWKVRLHWKKKKKFNTLQEIVKTYSEFFDEKWEVINEKDIMISENGESISQDLTVF
jgi:hypothetical protein